jgi:hypothetical protein
MTEIMRSQVQPAAGAQARSRAWTFEKTSTGPFPGSREPQRDRYWAARNRPTCRNRGPSGRSFGNGTWVKTFHVVLPMLPLEPGTVLPSGLVAPSTSATLRGVPLAPAVRSGGRAKKLLRQLQACFPDAEIWELCSAPGRDYGSPSVDAPGAPAGWVDVRAPELAPRMSWKQFVVASRALAASSVQEVLHG